MKRCIFLSLTAMLGSTLAYAGTLQDFDCLAVGTSMEGAERMLGTASSRDCATSLGVESCTLKWKPSLLSSEQYVAVFVMNRLVSRRRCSGDCR